VKLFYVSLHMSDFGILSVVAMNPKQQKDPSGGRHVKSEENDSYLSDRPWRPVGVFLVR
jgi:hypothetical protein